MQYICTQYCGCLKKVQSGSIIQLSPCEIHSCSDKSEMLGHPLWLPNIYQKNGENSLGKLTIGDLYFGQF